jgi:Zn-dependent protease
LWSTGRWQALQLPYFTLIMVYIIQINVVWRSLTASPIPPLDGSKILAGLLPAQEWL